MYNSLASKKFNMLFSILKFYFSHEDFIMNKKKKLLMCYLLRLLSTVFSKNSERKFKS